MQLGKALEYLVQIIKKYYSESETTPVLPFLSPEILKQEIDMRIRADGVSEETIFQELEKIVLTTPKTSSKGFFNLLYGGKILPAVMAEMLTSMLNTTMHTFKSAGVHVLIEQEVVQFFLKKI